MTLNWMEKFAHKKIVILGYGLEGKSTYKALKTYCPNADLQIMDRNEAYVRSCFAEKEPPYIYKGDQYLQVDQDVDFVFKSPGIPLMQLESHIADHLITSQTNEFIGAYKDQIFGITGTKGKSTTSVFLSELLEAHQEEVVLVGNIGKPAFDYIQEGADNKYFVYELSSHQLETAKNSPKYSLVLNLFEEHLDHYKSFEHYKEAKLNIGRYQTKEDWLIVHSSLEKDIKDFPSKKLTIGWEGSGVKDMGDGVAIAFGNSLVLDDGIDRKLLGHHNLLNMTVGILMARLAGFDDTSIELAALSAFKGLPHRLAYVETVNQVAYYNDSISTIPQATIAAIEAIPTVATVIVGGMDRGIDYSVMTGYIENNQDLNWLMLPDSGHKIMSQVKPFPKIHKVSDLEEAVKMASKITPKGSACLLSPAAASYGFFKNFEARGDIYESLIREMSID